MVPTIIKKETMKEA
jgi:hypothetical protein